MARRKGIVMLLGIRPGSIRGRRWVRVPRVVGPDGLWASTRVRVPIRFEISERATLLREPGRTAARQLFAGHQEVSCSVAFATGPIARTIGSYADPGSPWYSIFYGGYEVVSPQELGPYGYGENGKPDPSSVLRLGLADWAFLSAYGYGSPLSSLAGTSSELDAPSSVQGERVSVGGIEWDQLEFPRIHLAGPSDAKPEESGVPPHIRLLWRAVFGGPPPVAESLKCELQARCIMSSWRHKDGTWRTNVFGGVANVGGNWSSSAENFLDAQLTALRGWIDQDLS